jgi:hypothetical protein
MIHSGKCPHCEATIGHAKAEPIEIRVGTTEKYKGISYFCPSCHAVLSVGMDPLGLNENLVIRLMKALGKG